MVCCAGSMHTYQACTVLVLIWYTVLGGGVGGVYQVSVWQIDGIKLAWTKWNEICKWNDKLKWMFIYMIFSCLVRLLKWNKICLDELLKWYMIWFFLLGCVINFILCTVLNKDCWTDIGTHTSQRPVWYGTIPYHTGTCTDVDEIEKKLSLLKQESLNRTKHTSTVWYGTIPIRSRHFIQSRIPDYFSGLNCIDS